MAKEKDIVIETKFEADNIVEADIWILETVIKNILHNAIKYSFRGGKIEISTKKQKDKLQISVQDFGMGIDDARLKNIFHLEKREPLSGTEKETGTGLGLLISKELIEKSGDRIWINGVIGKGSVCVFTTKFIS
jgi:signal transduction histidine kinase